MNGNGLVIPNPTFGALRKSSFTPLEELAPITPTPFELEVAIILRLSPKLLSLVITSTSWTEPPASVALVTIESFPIAITVGGTL